MKTVTEYLVSLVQKNDIAELRATCQKLTVVQTRFTAKGYAVLNYPEVAGVLLNAAIKSKLDNPEMVTMLYRSGVTESDAGVALLLAEEHNKTQQLTQLLKFGARLNKQCRQSSFYRESVPEEVKAKLEARMALEDALLALNQAPWWTERVTHARENAIHDAVYKCAFAYPAILADFIMDITRHLRSNPLTAENWQTFKTAVEKLPKNWCDKYIDYDPKKLEQYRHPEQKEQQQNLVALPDADEAKIQQKADEVINALLTNIGALGQDDDDDNSLNIEELKWYFITPRKIPETPKNSEVVERVSRILILTKSPFDFYLQQSKSIVERELTKEETITVANRFRQACKLTLLMRTARQLQNGPTQENDVLPLPGFLDGQVTKLKSIRDEWVSPSRWGVEWRFQQAKLAPLIYIRASEIIDVVPTEIPARLLLLPLGPQDLNNESMTRNMNNGMEVSSSVFAYSILLTSGEEALRVLLENGADMKRTMPLGYAVKNLFSVVAASGDLGAVKVFVEYSAQDDSSEALLSAITYHGEFRHYQTSESFQADQHGIAAFLLSKFKYSQAQLDYAFSEAIRWSRIDIARLLVDKGANPNASACLWRAARPEYENKQAITYLLSLDVDIYNTIESGQTALQVTRNEEIKKLIRAKIPKQAKSLTEVVEVFFDPAFIAKVGDSPLIDYLRVVENPDHPKRLTAANNLFWCQQQLIQRGWLCTNAKLQLELTAILKMDAALLKAWLNPIVKNYVKNPFNFSAWQECVAILEKVLAKEKEFAELLVELKNYKHKETPLEKQAASSSSSTNASVNNAALSDQTKARILLIAQQEMADHVNLIATDEKQIQTLLALFAPKLCRDANESIQQGELQLTAKKLLKKRESGILRHLDNPIPMSGVAESQVNLARDEFLAQLAVMTKALLVKPAVVAGPAVVAEAKQVVVAEPQPPVVADQEWSCPRPPQDEPSLNPGAFGVFGQQPSASQNEDTNEKKVASAQCDFG